MGRGPCPVPAEASSLAGRLQYLECGLFARCAGVALHCIRQWAARHGASSALLSGLDAALNWLLAYVEVARPRLVPV